MIVAFLAVAPPAGAKEQVRPVENMQDVQAYLVQCFRPPKETEGMQATVHFSLNREGGLLGPPRIAWFKFHGDRQKQTLLESRLVEAFARCFPIPLSKDMARLAPGKVYFFRFGVGAAGFKGGNTGLGPY